MGKNWTCAPKLFAAVLATTLVLGAAGTAQAQDKVYAASELSAPASVKSKEAVAAAVERNYPERLQRVGGKVQLQFVVEPDGSVDPASVKVVVASPQALGDAAVRAVKHIRFNPGQVDGKPVRTMVMFPVFYAAR